MAEQKLLLITLFAVVIVSVSGYKEELAALHKECLKESGANPDLMAKANNGEFTDEESFKCYLKCVTMKSGVMSEDGSIAVRGEFIKLFPEDHRKGIEEMITTCADKVSASSSQCQKAFDFHKCSQKLRPKDYVLSTDK